MTRREWLEGTEKSETEKVFLLARGCQNCGYYLPVNPEKSGFICIRPDLEEICRKEHEAWLDGEMDV